LHNQFPRANCQRNVHCSLPHEIPCTPIRAVRPNLQKNLLSFEKISVTALPPSTGKRPSWRRLPGIILSLALGGIAILAAWRREIIE
jgi:hypothetical protein